MAWLFLAVLTVISISSSYQQDKFVPMVEQGYSRRINFQLEQQIVSYVRQEVTYIAYASYYKRGDVALPGFSRLFSSMVKTARKHAFSLTLLVNSRGGHVTYPVVQVKKGCQHIQDELSKAVITRPSTDLGVTTPARNEPHICNFLVVLDSDKELTVEKKKTVEPEKKPSKDKASKTWWWRAETKTVQITADGADDKPDDLTEATEKDQADTRDMWQDGLLGLEDALALEKSVLQELLSIVKMTRRGLLYDPQIKHQLQSIYVDDQVHSVFRVAELVRRLQQHQALDTYNLEEYLLDQELMLE